MNADPLVLELTAVWWRMKVMGCVLGAVVLLVLGGVHYYRAYCEALADQD